MRRLLAIVALGTIAFLVVAMLQEWRLFATSWFGRTAEPPTVSDAEGRQAIEVVERVLALERHYYASGGDPRFAERMPVSDELRDAMEAEIDYLSRNRRRQALDLHGLEVKDVRRLDAEHLEVRTREYWTIRTLEAEGDGETDPARPEVEENRYLLKWVGTSWRVDYREPLPAEPVPAR